MSSSGTGSSPLARGLPSIYGRSVYCRRIIPARAGFTRPPEEISGEISDHPRSRGVYSAGRYAIVSPSGSSPLARGLPRRFLSVMGGSRIIPARAGFTAQVDDAGHRAAGSSPLARGLPQEPPQGAGGFRIIPARAGFTAVNNLAGRVRRDHPRSRGVYFPGRSLLTGSIGSSPLARGLPCGATCPYRCHRIIPARAGFTACGRVRRSLLADHPRSRGVYPSIACLAQSDQGSSPLARGLLIGDSACGGAGRIIPARAGFTIPADAPQALDAGSSPLARGLPQWQATTCAGLRIIPARAGFTSTPSTRPRTSSDHPRSRGVYGRGWCARRRASRIIPARAGFTLPCTRSARM